MQKLDISTINYRLINVGCDQMLKIQFDTKIL